MKTTELQTIEQEMASVREAIVNETVSYGELYWLQDHIESIQEGDTLLLQWAGVEETF